MFKITTFKDKKVAVFGLGRSGNASALALQEGGAIVYAWDDNLKTREAAQELGINIHDLKTLDFKDLHALIMTPGVPIYGPKVHWSALMAQAENVPIIGDIEIFAREINAIPSELAPKIIGITGTNGKSTTTALIAHILENAGKDVQMGGNIGTGILSLEPPKAGAFYVLELSSYQLDLTKSLKLNVAIQLNISEDHLERHGTMDRYVAAKRNIFANQSNLDTAIIGVDDDWGEAQCTNFVASGNRKIIPVSSWQFVSTGVCAIAGVLWDAQSGRAKDVADLRLAKALPGAHNGQNAAAAFAACKALGLSTDIIVQGIYSFGGLKHRLQDVSTISNVKFYNDSKATNADASMQALKAFDKLRWIVGGEAKTDGIDPLAPLFGHITKAYLIGAAAQRFAGNLVDVPHQICNDMETAVRAAFNDARQNPDNHELVVLSPACASFDQYKDFEARGDHFISIVNQLSKESLN
jgi:UDP-N-acetylmuramoylalanine--D-glutamate ligase